MGSVDSFLRGGVKAPGAWSLPLTPIYIDQKLRFSGAILPVQNCTPLLMLLLHAQDSFYVCNTVLE